ncbi:MAG TPA: PKD domain-containing protein, partial [Polyangia bacterium]|nr:PKD domain-containing protein [Polyangia bacterium]
MTADAPAGGSFSQPVVLNPASNDATSTSDGYTPGIAVDAAGDVSVVFDTEVSSSPPFDIWWAHRPAGGSWSTPRNIGGSDYPGVQLAADARGDLAAYWTGYLEEQNQLAANLRPAGGEWQGAHYLTYSPSSSITSPDVVVGPDGVAYAVWSQGTLQADAGAPVELSQSSSAGTWSTPAAIGVAGSSALEPVLGIDGSGDKTLVWSSTSGGGSPTYTLSSAVQPAGGAWGASTTLLGSSASPPKAQIAIDPGGQAIAIWGDFHPAQNFPMYQAAVRTATGAWQATPTDLTGTDEGSYSTPAVVEDEAGDGLVGWDVLPASGPYSAHVEAYDATGPVMSGLSIPTTGTVGVPVTFAVSPLDAWSAVSATQWSFGDGASAIDQTVSHTYTRSGTYTVGVTAADILGNPSSGTGTIVIGSAPPGSGGGGASGGGPGAASGGGGGGAGAGPTESATALTLSRISQSHRRWRDGHAHASLARARHPKPTPVGTRFAFTLNESARVTFTFTQLLAGRRVKRRCAAPTTTDRHARACQRTKRRGTLTYSVAAGAHDLSFDGLIGPTRLGAGSYAVTVLAAGASGGSRT